MRTCEHMCECMCKQCVLIPVWARVPVPVWLWVLALVWVLVPVQV